MKFETDLGNGEFEYNYSADRIRELAKTISLNEWRVSSGVLFAEAIFGEMSIRAVVQVAIFCESIIAIRNGVIPVFNSQFEPAHGEYIRSL